MATEKRPTTGHHLGGIQRLARAIEDKVSEVDAINKAALEARTPGSDPGAGLGIAIAGLTEVLRHETLVMAWELVTGDPWAGAAPLPEEELSRQLGVPLPTGVSLAYRVGPGNVIEAAKFHRASCGHLHRIESYTGRQATDRCWYITATPNRQLLRRRRPPVDCGSCKPGVDVAAVLARARS